MGIGVALILIAAGLILWLVANLAVIGAILLIVGVVGVILAMVFWSSWGGVGGERRRTTVIEE